MRRRGGLSEGKEILKKKKQSFYLEKLRMHETRIIKILINHREWQIEF